MNLNGTEIESTFAEAFDMVFVRLEITAADPYWVDIAVREFSGYGTSVIQCDAEVGLELLLSPDQTMDGRHGASVMAFGFSRKSTRARIDETGRTDLDDLSDHGRL